MDTASMGFTQKLTALAGITLLILSFLGLVYFVSISTFSLLTALRIPGLNSRIAVDKICVLSLCKKLASGSRFTSASSRAAVASSSPLESPISTSRSPRRDRNNISAWLMAIRVNQVDIDDFPSNFRKWTNAFWKVC